MADNPNELKLSIGADTSDFYRQFKRAEQITEKVGTSFKSLSSYINKAEYSFDEINKISSAALKQLTKVQNELTKSIASGDIAKQRKAYLDFKKTVDNIKGVLTTTIPFVAMQGVFPQIKSDIEITSEAINKLTESETRNAKSAKESADVFKKVFDAEKAQRFAEKLVKAKANLRDFLSELDPKKARTAALSKQFDELQKQFVLTDAKPKTERNKAFLESIKSQIALNREGFLSQDEKDQSERITKAKEALEQFELSLTPVKQRMHELRTSLEQAEQAFQKAFTSGDAAGVEAAKKSIISLNKQINKLEQSTHKSASAWQKLMGRIRNISIYRMIRTGMKWLTSGVSEGLQGLAQYSNEVNESMSKINNSLGQVRNTLSITFASLLQSLEPIIIEVTDTIIDVLNAFNRALAKAQGKDFYYQAKKSADAYAESAKKARELSFDAFESLSGDDKTGTKDLFNKVYFDKAAKDAAKDTDAMVESAEDANNAFNGIADTLVSIGKAIGDIVNALGGLKTVLAAIAGYLVFKGVTSALTSIPNLITNISTTLAKLKTNVKDVIAGFQLMHEKGWGKEAMASFKEFAKTGKGVATMLGSVAAAAAGVTIGIISVVKNWENMSTTGKALTIVIMSLTAVIAAAAFAIYAATFQWAKAFSVAGGILATGFTVAGGLATLGFAEGGFTTANFIATNENGKREWVGRNAGATAVVNDTQMSDIMYQAVREGCYQGILQAMYDNPSGNNSDFSGLRMMVNENVLGEVVANSRGFTNAFNRKNAPTLGVTIR